VWLLAPLASAAPEVCNGLDDDGDGAVDEAPLLAAVDLDGDGHASGGVLTATCGPSLPVDDCDDADPLAHPGLSESCDGKDDDCDGQIDEVGCDCDVVVDQGVWQLCANLLPFAEVAAACAADGGYHVATIDDATQQGGLFPHIAPLSSLSTGVWIGLSDEGSEGAFYWVTAPDAGVPYTDWRTGEPNNGGLNGAPENCVEMEWVGGLWDDQRCTDLQPYACEADAPVVTWYADADGDGLADPGLPTAGFAWPAGTVSNALDCDDLDPTEPAVRFEDDDGDGWGTEEVAAIDCVPGAVATGDCDDRDGGVHPGGVEVCNQLDDDCDGAIDDGEAGPWWEDADHDGFGDPYTLSTDLCPPPDAVTNGLDCDDRDPDTSPLALDLDGDGVDRDCDGTDGPGVDADDDGLSDAVEGQLGTDPRSADTDHDALGDGDEVRLGTDPLDPDSDRDGRLDGAEPRDDADSDGAIDPLDPDDDGDGVPSADESDDDLDRDGSPSWLDPDSDGDGVWDGADPEPDDAGGGVGDGSAAPTAMGFGLGCDAPGLPPTTGALLVAASALLRRRVTAVKPDR
jgi:hypothetical protein